MRRRNFLHPRFLSQTAGQVLGALDELRPEPEPAVSEEFALLRFSRRAMATTFEIMFPFGTPAALQMAETTLDEIDRLEDQLTVYRESSEVSRINALAPASAVPVEDRLFELLQLSARLSMETEGAFDITAGALVKAWGFFRGPRRVPGDTERVQALLHVGMRHVVLDERNRSVRFLRPGVEINLGSIGKGYAIDRAVELLRVHGNPPAALLHGGHSSVYAIGCEPGDERGWAVALRSPWDAEKQLGVVRLRDQALATSAATFRYLDYIGRKLGHILDPRSGWPAEGMASVSVVAPTAAEADALATAFFILGADTARHYCATHPAIGAILLEEKAGAVPLAVGRVNFFEERPK
jgi:thiamine biosynthesis lipoprotein